MSDQGWTEVTSKRRKVAAPPKEKRAPAQTRPAQARPYMSRDLRSFLRQQREHGGETQDAQFDHAEPLPEGSDKLSIQRVGIFRNYQDHRETIIRKKKPAATKTQRRGGGGGGGAGGAGGQGGGGPQREVGEARRLTKLADQTDSQKHQKVKKSLVQKIQTYRRQHKLTQAQLAQKLSVKEEVVKKFEKGEALHDPQLVQKFERFFHREDLKEKASASEKADKSKAS